VPNEWVEKCINCSAEFSIFKWKNHCRLCGRSDALLCQSRSLPRLPTGTGRGVRASPPRPERKKPSPSLPTAPTLWHSAWQRVRTRRDILHAVHQPQGPSSPCCSHVHARHGDQVDASRQVRIPVMDYHDEVSVCDHCEIIIQNNRLCAPPYPMPSPSIAAGTWARPRRAACASCGLRDVCVRR
jgi:hypothetical protein